MANKKQLNGVHILHVTSESGDDFGTYAFKEKIEGQELLDFLRTEVSPCDCGDIVVYDPHNDEGPGFSGTYLFVSWND